MLTCTACGTSNDPGAKFCVECGTRLAAGCPACGTLNPAGAKFCAECGTSLAGGSGPGPPGGATRIEPFEEPGSLPAPGGPIAERRLVSVLFTDLVGFTTVSEHHDAEETRDLLSRYFETAQQIVERHGGAVEKFIGDAVMAVWGTPTAHEDDAERAVRTALELVAAVGSMEIGGEQLQARAGVLTGEAAVTIGATNQGMVAGDLVNTASRIQSAAQPATVLVGEATMRAASGAIAFEEAGERELKGKAAPVPVWRAIAVVARRGGSGRAAQLEPPFVGRDEELRALKEQFHATAREGKPRLVTVVGQAGIGKSRLGWELEKYLDGVVETIWFHEGRSPSYGEGISYWALAEMVRGRAGIAETDEPAGAREKLHATVEQFVADPAERRWIEPRLAGLLGMDDLPEESREELFAAWRTFFERMAEQGTVLLVFWDLQWADQGLLDFVEHLLSWARTSPVFVLAEARSELLDRRPGWGTSVRAATTIHLEPLADADMRRLLAGLVPNMPEAAQRAIVGRAEGVPLYAVETLRMLLDRGILHAEGGRYTLDGELPDLAVPETLQALIAARLDALGAEDRAVVTDASVLGLSFTVDALAVVSGAERSALEDRLRRLERREMLVLDAEPRSSERGQYRFVQGVVREVAYQSIAHRDRRAKHLAAARHYESLGEAELAGVLASHYLAAYHSTPPGKEADTLAAQARVALRAAADRALALHSAGNALGYLRQALEVTPDPAERVAIHERAAYAASQSAETEVGEEQARLAETIYGERGDRLGVLRARTLRAEIALSDHRDHDATAILEPALAEVADLPPSREAAVAQGELSRVFMLRADPRAVHWADAALASARLLEPSDVVEILVNKGSSLAGGDRSAEGEVLLRGAINVAERIGDVPAQLRARNNLIGQLELNGLDEAAALNRGSYEIARRLGIQSWVLQTVGMGLRVVFDRGDWDTWVSEAEAEMPAIWSFYRVNFEGHLALRRAYRGGAAGALDLLGEMASLEVSQSSAQARAFLAAQRGDVLIALGRFEEAYDAARSGWGLADISYYSILAALFAATALADVDRVREALAAGETLWRTTLPGHRGFMALGRAMDELASGRWPEARAAYREARGLLEQIGARTIVARQDLAVGHAAAGRFPDADEAARAAERFFSGHGADGYVATWRAMAISRAGTPAGGGRGASRAAGGEPARSRSAGD